MDGLERLALEERWNRYCGTALCGSCPLRLPCRTKTRDLTDADYALVEETLSKEINRR